VVLLSLVTALSRIDYGNATLAGLPTRQLCRLQSVLESFAIAIVLLTQNGSEVLRCHEFL